MVWGRGGWCQTFYLTFLYFIPFPLWFFSLDLCFSCCLPGIHLHCLKCNNSLYRQVWSLRTSWGLLWDHWRLTVDSVCCLIWKLWYLCVSRLINLTSLPFLLFSLALTLSLTCESCCAYLTNMIGGLTQYTYKHMVLLSSSGHVFMTGFQIFLLWNCCVCFDCKLIDYTNITSCKTLESSKQIYWNQGHTNDKLKKQIITQCCQPPAAFEKCTDGANFLLITWNMTELY